ncbi:MFS transporter [Streptomyces sp. NPDC046942]|uniref:MFS transporter n=1 Tax=Streptomyces sp. NPDC046942 TaxID=3155137 RepID=UPI0033F66C11
MESGLPVFVLRQLALPHWTVGALFAANTVLLTLLQLPVGRALDRFRPGAILALGGLGYLMLYVCAVLARSLSSAVAVAVLMAGMTVYTLGELAVSQPSLILLTGLPPEPERGSYLAVNQLLVGAATALAPLLATSLPGTRSPALWWTLAALSVVAALLTHRVGRPTEPEAAGKHGDGSPSTAGQP